MNNWSFTLGFILGTVFTVIVMFVLKKLFFNLLIDLLLTKYSKDIKKENIKPKPRKNLKSELEKKEKNGKITDSTILEKEINP